jgi:hypothetical protein
MLSVTLYMVLLSSLLIWVLYPSAIFSNRLIIRPNPAEDLEHWLKKFNWGQRSELHSQPTLPQYKFYTEILEIILGLARKVGGSYQDSLLFLRQGLQSDRQFEKKLRENILGAWVQMILMVVLTWLFIFCALTITNLSIDSFKLLGIAIWQAAGLMLLPYAVGFFRRRLFGDIGKLWKMLYVLQCLVKVPLPRSDVLTAAGVTALKEIRQKNLAHLVEKLKQTCQRTLQQGLSYEEDVQAMMEELRFQEKWHFELFEKRMTMVKLGLMAIFFLPSYLVFMFLLLGDLMQVM